MAKKILEFLNHQRYQMVAAFICILLTVWGLSCESKVRSLADPTRKITRDELRIEVDQFLATAEIRFKNLDLQDNLKALVFDRLVVWSQTGVFNPMGMIPIIIGLLGTGAVTDNVRLRIKNKKLNNVSKSD